MNGDQRSENQVKNTSMFDYQFEPYPTHIWFGSSQGTQSTIQNPMKFKY